MAEKSPSTQKPKMEFSKIMIVVAGITNIAVIVFACVMMWRTFDTTPLTYLIPSVAAEVATGSSFYYAKASRENQIKLKQIYGNQADEVADDTSPVG